MSLVEIARLTDVAEADLAAAFLASYDIHVSVTERFQTTVDPLMQRALGIRLMVPASQAEEARSLLARAAAGEFSESDDEDDTDQIEPPTRAAGTVLALFGYAMGGFWGGSLPRRFRPIAWQGMLLSIGLIGAAGVLIFAVKSLLFDPP